MDNYWLNQKDERELEMSKNMLPSDLYICQNDDPDISADDKPDFDVWCSGGYMKREYKPEIGMAQYIFQAECSEFIDLSQISSAGFGRYKEYEKLRNALDACSSLTSKWHHDVMTHFLNS